MRPIFEPPIGLEPMTCWLQISCSTNWAKEAFSTGSPPNLLKYNIGKLSCDAQESNLIYEAYETTPDTNRSARHVISCTNVWKRFLIKNTLHLFFLKVAGLGLEPRTSAYETDEITIFYASRNISVKGGNRTHNRLNHNQVLYHFSYNHHVFEVKVGIEPTPWDLQSHRPPRPT